MYINLKQLTTDLEKRFRIRYYHVSDSILLSKIEMLPDQKDLMAEDLEENVLYLCDYRRIRHLNPFIRQAPILCVVPPNAEPDPIYFEGRTVVVVYDCDLTEVMLALTNMIYRYGRNSSEILEISQILIDCKTPEELLDKAYEILGNPIVVTDGKQKILNYTAPSIVRNNLYLNISALDYLPVGHPVLGSADTFWIHEQEPVISDNRSDLPSVICRELMIGGTTRGFLHILQFNRAFQEEDNYIITLLGNLLSIYLWKDPRYIRPEENEMVNQFLRDILDGKILEANELQRRKEECGIHLGKYLYLASIVNNKKPMPKRIPFWELAALAEQKIPGTYGFLYRNSVMLLMSTETEHRAPADLLEALMPTLEKYGMSAGISNCFIDIHQLRNYGFQSVKALEIGSIIKDGELVYTYQDYAIYHMIENSLPHGGARNYCMPQMLLLRDYCKENGSELMTTLRTFLDCGCNKTLTAKTLFTHVNTIKYRLGQIENIMGIDPSDSSNTIPLLISVKTLEYTEHMK